MNFENRNFYNGQMDRDSAPELVQQGTYSYALNVRSYNPETGSVGTITNVNGNTETKYDFSKK